MKNLFFCFLFVVMVACSSQITVPVVNNNSSLQSQLDARVCVVDSDCFCGGVDVRSNDCFLGNREYAKKYVDMNSSCPDFCGGKEFAHLEVACQNRTCVQVPRMMNSSSNCKVDGTSCCSGDRSTDGVCMTIVADCMLGQLPVFQGCSQDCKPEWTCYPMQRS